RRRLAPRGRVSRRRGLRRRGRVPRRRRLPRPRARAVAVVAVLLALAAGAWLWLRNSPLVAVQRVTVIGVSGRDASQIRSALIAAARNMTTLNVKMGALRTAVEPFPVVKRLHVSTDFPHRMRIAVVEQVPVATISAAGQQVAVSADGTLLNGYSAPGSLPAIPLAVSPAGTHLTGATMRVVRLLGAAPYQLLAKVSQASDTAPRGLQAQLRNGPKVYFGTDEHLAAKWAAAAAVIADPDSAGAGYIDVTVPSRPAAGAGSDSGSSARTTGASATG
ncbi:MAG: cell division protein FtsQ/DivIB, partial [Solirubrobacteraceae bacterium]